MPLLMTLLEIIARLIVPDTTEVASDYCYSAFSEEEQSSNSLIPWRYHQTQSYYFYDPDGTTAYSRNQKNAPQTSCFGKFCEE